MKRGTSLQYATPPADAIIEFEDLGGRDARWIQRALGVAYTSQHRTPMGAVAVSGGSLLATAVNKYRNSPVISDWDDCSFHAEAALARSRNIEGSTVYVARSLKSGDAALAKPCRTCLATLTAAGVRRVIWTTENGAIGRMNLG